MVSFVFLAESTTTPATATVSVAGLACTDRALCCWGHGGFQILARDHEDGKPPEREEVEALQKNRIQYLFFTSQSRFPQITHLPHVASL